MLTFEKHWFKVISTPPPWFLLRGTIILVLWHLAHCMHDSVHGCPPLCMDQVCAHSALSLAWPKCHVCMAQSLLYSCIMFSSHLYFTACVPCSRQSFSEELRSGRGIYLKSGRCISFLESPKKQWSFDHLYSSETDFRRQQDGCPDSQAPEP